MSKQPYLWAANEAKLQRAIQKANDQIKAENAVLKAQNKPEVSVTEELVKEIYVSLAGLLKEDAPEVVVKVEDGVKKVSVKRKTPKVK